MEREEPSLVNDLKLTVDPQWSISKTLILFPSFPIERKEKLDPRFKKSKTDAPVLSVTPGIPAAFPLIDTVDPSLAKLLNDVVEPRFKQSKTEKVEAHFPNDRTESDECV